MRTSRNDKDEGEMRPLTFLVVGYLGLLLEGALKAVVGAPLHLPTPEVMLLVVLYLGLKPRGSAPQLLGVALACGYLADLLAGSPKGLLSLTLGVIVLIARAASSRLMVASTWQVAAVAAAAAVGHSLAVFVLTSMYAESLGAVRMVPGIAIMTGLLAPLVFWVLDRVDGRFATDPHRLRMVPGRR
jgi:rod shape-determining protein MreD